MAAAADAKGSWTAAGVHVINLTLRFIWPAFWYQTERQSQLSNPAGQLYERLLYSSHETVFILRMSMHYIKINDTCFDFLKVNQDRTWLHSSGIDWRVKTGGYKIRGLSDEMESNAKTGVKCV